MSSDSSRRDDASLFRQVFEHSGDLKLILRPVPGAPPVIVDVNAASLRAHGYTREELIGQPITLLEPTADAGLLEARAQQFMAHGDITFEATHRRKDGSVFDVEVVASQIHVAGEPLILCVERDITDRKRAEHALKQSERKFYQAFHGSAGIFAITTLDGGRFVDVNDRFLDFSGYERDEVIGQTVFDLRLWADSAQATQLRELLRRDGHVTAFESTYRRKSGEIGYGLVSAATIDVDGVPCLLTETMDITQRKRVEEEREILKYSIDHAPIGAYWFDPEGRLTYVNEAGCRAFGYSRDEMLGMTLIDLNPRATPERLAQVWQQLKETGSYISETEHRRKDGTVWTAQITSGYVSYGGREYNHGYAVDITERRRAEREREGLQEQLLQAQKMESIGRLAGGVAHDFNNMLSVITGHVELALEQVEPGSSVHGDLVEIAKAAERSADLTRQLLAFARRQTVSPRVLDLNGVVEGMLTMLRRLIGEDVVLQWSPGAHVWPISIDPSQVSQILTNLAVNARDAIADVGTLTISTRNACVEQKRADRVAGDYVLLEVRDDGCGMGPDTVAHLFEPFFTTKRQGQGTGLGLSTVYGIVTQNQGFIDVQTAPGAGTRFTIGLPRHAGAPADAEEGPSGRVADGGPETVLVVEDEPGILKMITRLLARGGYRVLAAATPGEAIQLAQDYAGEIHLLLADVVMPEMNGRDLARRLLSFRPGMRRLFMSGYTADVIAHRGVLDEGVHFLQKPFSAEGLAAKVREALGS